MSRKAPGLFLYFRRSEGELSFNDFFVVFSSRWPRSLASLGAFCHPLLPADDEIGNGTDQGDEDHGDEPDDLVVSLEIALQDADQGNQCRHARE